MIRLVKVALGSMFAWDTVRRLSPVEVHPIAARVVTAGVAYALDRWADDHTLTALAGAGGALALATVVHTSAPEPWGQRAQPYLDRLRGRFRRTAPPEPASKVGRRLPVLPL
jgi:hypothetical protein